MRTRRVAEIVVAALLFGAFLSSLPLLAGVHRGEGRPSEAPGGAISWTGVQTSSGSGSSQPEANLARPFPDPVDRAFQNLNPELSCYYSVDETFPHPIPVEFVAPRGGAIAYREPGSAYTRRTSRPCLAGFDYDGSCRSGSVCVSDSISAACSDPVATVECQSPSGGTFYASLACWTSPTAIDGSLFWVEYGSGRLLFSSSSLWCEILEPTE